MRLIDADELKLAIDEAVKTVSKEVGLSKQLTMELLAGFAHTVLNEAPTVKAIYIEWIKNYIADRSSLSINWSYVEDMLEEWEKENETN